MTRKELIRAILILTEYPASVRKLLRMGHSQLRALYIFLETGEDRRGEL